MKKVNLKGKLSLKKETMSKLDMESTSGGATQICGTSPVICQKSLLVLCQTININCLQTIKFPCTLQTVNCSLACPTTTIGPIGSLAC